MLGTSLSSLPNSSTIESIISSSAGMACSSSGETAGGMPCLHRERNRSARILRWADDRNEPRNMPLLPRARDRMSTARGVIAPVRYQLTDLTEKQWSAQVAEKSIWIGANHSVKSLRIEIADWTGRLHAAS